MSLYRKAGLGVKIPLNQRGGPIGKTRRARGGSDNLDALEVPETVPSPRRRRAGGWEVEHNNLGPSCFAGNGLSE